MCACEHGHLNIAKRLLLEPECDPSIEDNVSLILFPAFGFFLVCRDSMRLNFNTFTVCYLQSQSKWLGHFGVSLSPQCWCTRFGHQTAINNFERDEGETRREKTAFG